MARLGALLAALLVAIVLPLPSVVSQEPGVVHKDDPKGDVTVSADAANSPSLPDNDVISYVDILDLSITDVDEETLQVRIKTGAPFRLTPPQSRTSYGLEEVQHRLYFSIPGVTGQPVPAVLSVISAHVRTENGTPAATGYVVVASSLCFPANLQPYQSSCDFYGDPVPRSVDQGAIVLSISKIKLTQVGQEGQRVRNANLPGRLVAGDALVDVYARTTYRPVFLGTGAQAIPQVTDRAPDTGLLQVPLRYGSPAPDLRMKLGQSAVIGGQENQVPVEVQNLGTHKRIVNLSVELKPLVGPPPWSASITPSVTLGAGKSTNVTLRVNPPAADAKERSVAAIKLRATILTEPGTIAIATGYLVSVSALDRDHSTFYAWGAHQSWITVGTSVPFLGNGYGGLTRSENDDRFPGSPFEMYQRFGSSGGLTSWAFESPLVAEPIPNPALFRKGEPMKGVVEIEMPFPSAATLTVLAEFGPQLLVQQDRPISVVQGRNRFEVQAPMLPTANRLEPSNGTMKVTVRITVNGPEAGLYWTSFFGTNVPRLVPKTTHFNFPLDREYPAVESASNAKVFLTPAEELDAFLNPGNVQVFELDLRNEEPRPMQLALEALNVTEGWNVEIRPGARFRLAKEDSVRVGVLVRAPQTSMEGDVLRFRVVVREVANDTLVAGQWIRAIVTRGVDIENETFEPAQDDAKKLDAPTAKSPATPLVAALLALGAMAELRRRRRN